MKNLKITIVLIGYCATSMIYASQAQQKTKEAAAAASSSSSSAASASASGSSLSSAAAAVEHEKLEKALADKKALNAVELFLISSKKQKKQNCVAIQTLDGIKEEASSQNLADAYLAALDSLKKKLPRFVDAYNEAGKLKTPGAKANFYAKAAKCYGCHLALYKNFKPEKFILEKRMLIQKSFAKLHEKFTIENSQKAFEKFSSRAVYWSDHQFYINKGLINSARETSLVDMQRFLDMGADVNFVYNEVTALYYALINKSEAATKLLIENGACLSIGCWHTAIVRKELELAYRRACLKYLPVGIAHASISSSAPALANK